MSNFISLVHFIKKFIPLTKNHKQNYVFFLGGYDAEMVAIKEILDEKRISYFDKKLKWGAKLSEYKEELSKISENQIPVFIELNIDINYPERSKIIDHHGGNAGKDKKTSIEQVAELLGVELNRKQLLISANDKNYIWGMIEIGATDEEIKEIRSLDKKAQGVTEEDEKNAELSIKHYLKRLSYDTVIIYSLTEKISPIIDRVYKYYRHIFIITPSDEINYSGTGQIVELLIKHYEKLKETNQNIYYWYGGNLPKRGYFGSNYKLTEEEIINIIEPFIAKEIIYSQHIFMFPFTIEFNNKIEKGELKTSSVDVLKEIHERLKNSNWKYKPFSVLIDIPDNVKKKYSEDEIWFYNEYKYFYEFIHHTIFTDLKKEQLFSEDNHPISLYYEIDVSPNDEITFIIKEDCKRRNYTLKIDNISLRIFETGIGILSFTLYNTCYKNFEDIELINDYGRRIYPQFLGTDNLVSPIEAPKSVFLCDKIIFRIGNTEIIEDFKVNDYLRKKSKYANYIEELLTPINSNGFECKAVIDDRMFVICWYANNELMNELSKNFENNIKWYQFIFIDGKGAVIANEEMMKFLIKKCTYPRYSDWGTLFGITRYSFMCLCKCESVGDFNYRILRNHMQKIYYQMFVILLAQRASIIKFNKELELISQDADDLLIHKYSSSSLKSNKKINLENLLERTEKLYKNIILFSNRIWYKEITPQEQGIEIYKIALRNMEIESQFRSLRNKMYQLYNFMILTLENERTNSVHKLTYISTIFAVLVTIIAFWSIDFEFLRYWKGIDDKIIHYPNIVEIISLLISSSLAFGLLLILIINLSLKIISKRVVWLLFIVLVISSLIWIYLLCYN